MLVLLAMSWRFLRPYFLIAMIILTFWLSKKETKRLIFSKYSSGAIWLKYGPKKTWGSRNFSRFCGEAEVSRFARVSSSHFLQWRWLAGRLSRRGSWPRLAGCLSASKLRGTQWLRDFARWPRQRERLRG